MLMRLLKSFGLVADANESCAAELLELAATVREVNQHTREKLGLPAPEKELPEANGNGHKPARRLAAK